MQKYGITLALFLFSLVCLNGQKITLTAQNEPIDQVLDRIEKNYNVKFGYNIQQLRGLRTTVDAKGQDLSAVLDLILNPFGLVHDRIGTEYIAIHQARSVFVKVRVYDQMSLENLPYATIKLENSNLGTVTDENGEAFIILESPVGAKLTFLFLGYETLVMPINASKRSQEFAVGLSPITTSLGDVEVKEYLNQGIISDDMASSFEILPQNMEILPGLAERDALLSAQIISGIGSNSETATRLNIRGSSPESTFIYWNNIPIYQSGHYFGSISNFIPSSIGQIDVFKNFIPVQYNGPSSGMVALQSRTKLDGQSNYEGSLNMTHADFYTKLPFKKDAGAIMMSLRRSYNDIFSTPTFESLSKKLFNGNVVRNAQGSTTTSDALETDLRFSDVNLRWVYEPNSRSHWSTSFFRSGNRLVSSLEESLLGNSISQNHKVESYGLNLGHTLRINDNWSTQLSLSYSDYAMSYNFVNQRTDDDDDTDDDNQNRSNALKNIELRWHNNWQLNDRQILSFGSQLNHIDAVNEFIASNFLEEDSEELNDSKGIGLSIYGELNWDLSANWELILGNRFNYFSTLEKVKVNPQIRTNYRLSNPLILKASFGVYDQYLRALEETEFTLSNAIEQHWLLADEEETIPLTTNTQIVAGFLFQKKGWLIDMDLYHKNIRGLLARNLGFNVSNQAGLLQGNETIEGLDLTIRKRWKTFRIWSSYSFQDSKARLNGLQNSRFPSSLNIRHQWQIATTINLDPLELSLGYTFKSGLPYSTVNGVTLVQNMDGDSDDDEDDDEEQEMEFYQINYNDANRSRLNEYHRVDLSMWYKIKSQHKWRGEIGISLLNVLGRNNQFKRSYSIELDENNQATTVQRDRFLLGFTPNLSVRFNF